MRISECGLRAPYFLSSLLISSRAQIDNEETELKTANPKSAFRNT
jgi:hypothetical protein